MGRIILLPKTFFTMKDQRCKRYNDKNDGRKGGFNYLIKKYRSYRYIV